MTSIRNRLNMRAVALIMVVAIAGSGLASMAALTDTLTFSSDFAAVNAELKGNGTADTVVLFDNETISGGTTLFREVAIQNTGNIALAVSQPADTAVTGSETLVSALLMQAWIAKADATAPVCSAAGVADLTDWTIQQGAYIPWTGTKLLTGSIALDPNTERMLCVSAQLPAGEYTGTLSATSVLLGQ